MAGNAQKTPFVKSMNSFARAKAQNAIQQLGKSLPASVVKVMGPIVQVKFEVQSDFTLQNVTIPLIGCEYARPPIQIGCKGVVLAADAYLGGMSGLGGGVADLTKRGNLTALVFAPIGNNGWTAVDGNAYVIYGPNGAVVRDTSNASNITLTPTQIRLSTGSGVVSIVMTGTSITFTIGGQSISLDSAGFAVNGQLYHAHQHTNVANGPNNTGGVL